MGDDATERIVSAETDGGIQSSGLMALLGPVQW